MQWLLTQRYSRRLLLTLAAGLGIAAFLMWTNSSRTAPRTTQVAVADSNLSPGFIPGRTDVVLIDIAADSRVEKDWLPVRFLGKRVLVASVTKGQILTHADVAQLDAETADFATVAMKVESGHVPVALKRGQTVDIWSTPQDVAVITGGSDASVSRRVVANTPVISITDDSMSGDHIVEVNVSQADVARVVQATHAGSIDLVLPAKGVRHG